MKQAILLRKDLKMSIGKSIVQACHASLGAYRIANMNAREKWSEEGEKKVVLLVKNLKELKLIQQKCKKNRLPNFLVKDAGLTELQPGTITALGVGPIDDKKIDKITGSLPLL